MPLTLRSRHRRVLTLFHRKAAQTICSTVPPMPGSRRPKLRCNVCAFDSLHNAHTLYNSRRNLPTFRRSIERQECQKSPRSPHSARLGVSTHFDNLHRTAARKRLEQRCQAFRSIHTHPLQHTQMTLQSSLVARHSNSPGESPISRVQRPKRIHA